MLSYFLILGKEREVSIISLFKKGYDEDDEQILVNISCVFPNCSGWGVKHFILIISFDSYKSLEIRNILKFRDEIIELLKLSKLLPSFI
jgi:hypothetical protein